MRRRVREGQTKALAVAAGCAQRAHLRPDSLAIGQTPWRERGPTGCCPQGALEAQRQRVEAEITVARFFAQETT